MQEFVLATGLTDTMRTAKKMADITVTGVPGWHFQNGGDRQKCLSFGGRCWQTQILTLPAKDGGIASVSDDSYDPVISNIRSQTQSTWAVGFCMSLYSSTTSPWHHLRTFPPPSGRVHEYSTHQFSGQAAHSNLVGWKAWATSKCFLHTTPPFIIPTSTLYIYKVFKQIEMLTIGKR